MRLTIIIIFIVTLIVVIIIIILAIIKGSNSKFIFQARRDVLDLRVAVESEMIEQKRKKKKVAVESDDVAEKKKRKKLQWNLR